ncbi:unnamed protein product [Discosporangium mesarthrocarpum]
MRKVGRRMKQGPWQEEGRCPQRCSDKTHKGSGIGGMSSRAVTGREGREKGRVGRERCCVCVTRFASHVVRATAFDPKRQRSQLCTQEGDTVTWLTVFGFAPGSVFFGTAACWLQGRCTVVDCFAWN